MNTASGSHGGLDVVSRSVLEPHAARILMVDDHPGNLLALEAILGPLGYPMIRAQSAEEALKHLIDGDFAVILMDVQMPGIDGFAAASLIKQRERTRSIPIIFITALTREAAFEYRGYEHGAVDYITKPIEPLILRSKVAVFVELFLQRQQLKRQSQRLLHDGELRNERRYRALCDSLPMSLWVTDRAGKVTYCNKRMQELCSTTQAVLDSDGWLHHIHVDDRDKVKSAWEECVAKASRREVEFRMMVHGGDTSLWHLGSIAPDDDTENGGRFIFAAADITAQKTAQEAAERASRLKDDFLATVSHELRTPLNAILGWSQTLLDAPLGPEKTRLALEAIERNARAQATIIADILDVSRIVTGKLTLNIENVQLLPLISSAVEVVRAAADAKGITLRVDPIDADLSMMGDANRVSQVLWNLLSNAVKFTPRDGTVRLRLRHERDEVMLAVEDTGNGIAPSFLPFVFDRFRQADSSSTRSHGGLGLGLAIVKHLVELLGGSVAAFSEGLGKGARFEVRLPLRGAARNAVTESVTTPEPPAPKRPATTFLTGRKVLVIDDDTDGRELIEMLFTRKGATAMSARSVAEAFAHMEQFKPDLIVSDIGMPGEDGYSLIRRLRAAEGDGAHVPAIALTGFAREDDGVAALNAGFHAHVCKPVQPAQLLTLVEKLLAAG